MILNAGSSVHTSKQPHPCSRALTASQKFRSWEKVPQQNGGMVPESL